MMFAFRTSSGFSKLLAKSNIELAQVPIRTVILHARNYQLLKTASSSQQIWCCQYSSNSKDHSHVSGFDLSNEICPQGIQGDNCADYKLWLENCRRSGLPNCDEQFESLNTGRKTLAQVLSEQEKLIVDVAQQYKRGQVKPPTFYQMHVSSPQGIQDDVNVLSKSLSGIQRRHFSTSTPSSHKPSGPPTSIHRIPLSTPIDRTTGLPIEKEPKPTEEKIGEGSQDKPELNQRQKLKRAVAEYGSTVIVFHVGISLMSLGFFYVLVSSGVDVVKILKAVGIGEDHKLVAGTSTFVMAYAVHKVFAPARIATTLTATPFIVRYLRRVGFLKVKT